MAEDRHSFPDCVDFHNLMAFGDNHNVTFPCFAKEYIPNVFQKIYSIPFVQTLILNIECNIIMLQH